MTDNEKIRSIRTEMGLSMDQFGAKLGVSGTAISLIESGKNNVSARIKMSAIKILGVNPDYFDRDDVKIFPQKTKKEEIEVFFKELQASDASDFRTTMISVLAQLGSDEWAILEKITRRLLDAHAESKKSPDD